MIRPATLEDAAALTEIYNHYILTTTVTFETEPLSREQMQRRIEEISAEGPYFVHESGGRVDGYCYAHRLGQRAAYEGSMEQGAFLPRHIRQHGECRALLEIRIRKGRLPEGRRIQVRQDARPRLLRTSAVDSGTLPAATKVILPEYPVPPRQAMQVRYLPVFCRSATPRGVSVGREK